MTTFVFANDASSTLLSGINAGAVSLTVAAGQGALFPNPSAGQQFSITLQNNVSGSPGLLKEIVYCTARTGDVLTIVRAQEGTTALSWSAGDFVSNFFTAGQAAAFQQGAATGVYYAVDSGAVNALVVTLSPVPANQAALVGVPIYILVGHTLTAPNPTLNANGFGAQTIAYKGPSGYQVVHTNAFAIGTIIQVVWDGTNYQLVSNVQSQNINTATDGFIQLDNGTIIQWGKVTLAGAGATFTLDIAFPTHGVSVVVQPLRSGGGQLLVQSSFTSNSVVTSDCYEFSGGAWVAASSADYHYIAIGY